MEGYEGNRQSDKRDVRGLRWRELTAAVAALYAGLDALSHLDRERSGVESVFAAAAPAAALFDSPVGREGGGSA